MSGENILEKISISVRQRLEARKKLLSQSEIEKRVEEARISPKAFADCFKSAQPHVIAEIKFRSPAKGSLATGSVPEAVKIAGQYLKAGATALSVLTEEEHFLGSAEYLLAIRKAYPASYLLMKDFVIDEYQLFEAVLRGADCALLIVSLLGENKLKDLMGCAQRIGLSVLVEVHDTEEMEIAVRSKASIIGINNRNLKTLEISLDTSKRLAPLANIDSILICESGIENSEQMKGLMAFHFSGFLMGTAFMKTPKPGEALSRMLKELRE